MKLARILLFALLISSCSDDVGERTDIRKLNFEGHEYIYFKYCGSYGYTILHSPNCICSKGNE